MTLRIQHSNQLLILDFGECNRFTGMIFSGNDIICKRRLTTLVLEFITRWISMQLVTPVNYMPHGSTMSTLWSSILGLSKILGVTRFGPQKLLELLMYQSRLSSQHPLFSASHLEVKEKTLCSGEA